MSLKNVFSNSGAKTLTIRFSQPADVPVLLDFYRNNRHPHVDYRGDALFTDRIESGRALVVFKPDGAIGMSSMSHPFNDPVTSSSRPRWAEIGSTVGSMDGLGLYPFVVATQVIEEFISRTPDDKIFACIYKSNPAVTDMLNKKVGWPIISPSADFALAVGEDPSTMGRLNWLHAESDSLRHQARIVIAILDKGFVENRKTGEKFALDVRNLSLANTTYRHLTELAYGRFGEMLEKAHPLPLQKARDTFDKYLNGARYFPEMHAKP